MQGQFRCFSGTVYAAFVFALLFPLSLFAATIDQNGPKAVIADKIEYNVRDKSIKTAGNTEVWTKSGQRMTLADAYVDEGGVIAYGTSAEIFLNSKTRIRAAEIVKSGDVTTAERITYTACHSCETKVNAWEISAARLKHDNETHYMHFENPVFRTYGIPVFWFPYMTYPDPTIRHKSGLLLPYINSTNNMGTQINIPLYIAVSDTHDFTFTASYLTAENPLWQLEHRLNANRSRFRTAGSFTSNQEGLNRWHMFNDDEIELGTHARAEIFFQRTSDKTYLQKYGFYDAQPYLDSGGRVELFAESGYVSTEVHFFQELRAFSSKYSNYGNLTDPSGDILPNIHGVFQTMPLFADTYMSFMGDMIGINNSDTGSATQRMLGAAVITSPWTLFWGQKLSLSGSVRYDVYNFINTDLLDGTNNWTGIKNRFLPSGYAEWSWALVNRQNNWTHVLEPRIRVTTMGQVKTPAFANIDSSGTILSDATLFSGNRFSGYDLWENGTYTDYGLSLFSYYGSNVALNGFFGQSYDFSPPIDLDPNSGFHDGFSDYVGRVGVEYDGWISLNNRFRFAENNLGLRHLETVAKIGARNYIEGGYIIAAQLLDADTVDKNISEIVAGFGINLTDRFSARIRTIYNITDMRIQRQNAGIYYDHPCYTVAFEYNKDGAVRENLAVGENYRGNTTFNLTFSLKLTETK
ncbi:MAG: LPS assembly protein LptD [Rickettsiales bacterium]|jgi:LPS-assembly protein|nr:LPS assembly protein LptD [Rickettsiales bacterium]